MLLSGGSHGPAGHLRQIYGFQTGRFGVRGPSYARETRSGQNQPVDKTRSGLVALLIFN